MLSSGATGFCPAQLWRPNQAHGYAQPAAVVWSSARNELWLVGAGAEWPASLARLALDADIPEWPRVPKGVHLETDFAVASLFSLARPARASSALGEAGGHLILVDQDGVLRGIAVLAGRVASAALLAGVDLGGEVTSAALDGDDIYLVLRGGRQPVRSSPGPAGALKVPRSGAGAVLLIPAS